MIGYLSKIIVIFSVFAGVDAVTTIPNTGNFFYSVLTMGLESDHLNDVNTMYLPILISNQTDQSLIEFRLAFSTRQSGI